MPLTEYEIVLRDFMGELAMGGYSQIWRAEALQSALIGYGRIWELEATGKGFVNRPNHVTAKKRRAENLTGKASWFKTSKSKESMTDQKSRPKFKKTRSQKFNDRIPPKI